MFFTGFVVDLCLLSGYVSEFSKWWFLLIMYNHFHMYDVCNCWMFYHLYNKFVFTLKLMNNFVCVHFYLKYILPVENLSFLIKFVTLLYDTVLHHFNEIQIKLIVD